MRVLVAGGLYFIIVFAAGFLFGALRVTMVAPRLGAVPAVLVELPLILCVSWFACGWILRRWPMRTRDGEDVLMGIVAFLLLMAGEAMLSVLLTGRPPADFLLRMLTAEGAIGLLGQIAFAALPSFRSRLVRAQ